MHAVVAEVSCDLDQSLRSTAKTAMPHPRAHAAAVVDRLLRRLASNVRRPELPSNIDEDVAHVGRILARFQDVLVSLGTCTEAQEWMGKIKQITYDMEDLLDDFEDRSTIIGSQWSGSCVGKVAPFFLHSTTENRLKTIKRKLEFSAKDSVVFSLMQNRQPDLEQLDDNVFDGSAIIGRDNDKAKIKGMLLQSSNEEKLSVIPIVGLVGLGKTSLARLIFYDQGEGWNFDLRIWISLKRKLDLKKVAVNIILQCSHPEQEELDVLTDIVSHEDLQLLKNRLLELFCKKRCLIVLDDLSSTDKSQLDELKEMLKGTNECTKVLVTTSSETTAYLVCSLPPYKLCPLSEDDIWTLFSQKAFVSGNSISGHLKEIGKQIAKRCEGIPLLACFLGSVVKDQAIDVWLAARDERLWKLERQFAIQMELFSSFYQIYNGLPSALKLCFLYLSIFPKGSIIDKENLIQQWIALDMIGSKHGSLPSYVYGEMCLQDLLSIYFLQAVKMHSMEEMDYRIAPTAVYMHNFIHEFALHVASDDIIILDDKKMWKGKRRRKTFQYALLTHYRGQSTLSRSLFTRTRALNLRNSEVTAFPSGAFEQLKHLRVLNLSGCFIQELPPSLGHLKCLRYLDVSDVPIQTLPSTMGRLTNLEALDLSKTSLRKLPCFVANFLKLKHLNMQGCDKLQNLPAALGHLQKLEHLRLSSCNDVDELPDSMCNIHDLRFFDLSRCTELQHLPFLFGNLVNLEDLNLSSCFNLKQLPESVGNLSFLRFLNLSSCYELQQLPESLTKLNKLEVLILRRCCRLQNVPSCLANIKFLRVLDLAGCEALHLGTEMLTTNLEYLNLRRCLKLQIQPHCFQNFTKLKFLNLSQCLRNTDFLQSVGYLFNLEYLNLSENFLDIPIFFAKLQKLHTLDLTGCRPIHLSSNVHKKLPDAIEKMTGLRFLLTKDPVLVACLPPHIQCAVCIDEHWHETTDELVIKDITGGPRGLIIADRLNLQNRLELRFLKLQWIPTSQSDMDELVINADEVDVLEKLQPNQCLEHFMLVKYAGYAFPTWMMDNIIISLSYLVSLCLFHLQNCKDLPPLGKLRNLRYLHIKGMPNLINLEMGLSGGPQSFKKLTHLKLETLMNLRELCILFPTDTGDQDFMFPHLEELSVLSCSQLIFKPSLPRCKRYEIRESNNILSCGEPLGPSSSPSPSKIEISGCLVSFSWLQWLKSVQSLQKVVMDECVGDDGEPLMSSEFWEIKGTQELSNTKIPHETKIESSSGTNISTQDGAHKVAGSGSSIIQKLLPRFNTTSANSADHTSSFEVTTPSKETLSISHNLLRSKMPVTLPGVGYLSLTQVKKATRKFSPSFKIGEGGTWTVYKAVLPDKKIVIVRRAKKGCAQYAQDQMKVNRSKINHWSLVQFLGVIDEGNEFIMITEYVPNGTLREHLNYRHVKILNFSQRMIIAIDVAIALTYLHLAVGETIICYNLKTENILLTESYRAKVCSCDLSGCGSVDPARGTAVYIDPEYFQTWELSAKSDVYAFGVVLLEIISSQKPADWSRWAGDLQMHNNIEEWARELFNEGRVNAILDYCLMGDVDEKVVRDLVELALRCAASRSDDRPSIEGVGARLWKIWIDHRRSIGEPHEYERSWIEFVKAEGIEVLDGSMFEGNLYAKSDTKWMTSEHQASPSRKHGVTHEAYSDTDDIYCSRSGSFDSITLSPR